ncbi:sugar ABC transporter ATP-binding protein [Enterococcus sp.]|uniref:sugar ABC transporter ATP-binding protein n=1 Tax=Enterococcus sp. TaxID=35783 RepID=UPI0029066BFA|nr:sugar ABC transporter ATP-binding protein [Enterococcus sp.]MDU5336558.1 sugar ABC transporter ATP-binding protein [Enterococcus sp.]
MEQRQLLSAKHITKKFGDVTALNDVSIQIESGKTIGLIGENGSGKSTISSIFSGIISPTTGSLKLHNEEYQPTNMVDALEKGIGMIVQEEGTISGITVAENIFLGNLKLFNKGEIISKKKMFEAAQEILDSYKLSEITAMNLIDHYSQEERKLIEVVKVLMKEPEVLIVDETTTALSQQGRDFIYQQMEKQKLENKASIFISHDLEELIEHCDQLIVLRDGHLVDVLSKDEFDENKIKNLMVGRELTGAYYREDFIPTYQDEILINCEELVYKNKVKNITLELHRGEILGIGGLSHCGMHELGKLLFGFLEKDSGRIRAISKKSEIKSTKDAIKAKIGYVSKNRDHEALALKSSVKDNIAIGGTDILTGRFGFISTKKERSYVDQQIEDLAIKTPSREQEVQFLSGGNKQKVVFGKWLARDCDILILDCPTRGIDIGVKAAMYRLMEEMKREGKSILLISEELPELLGMSDRILIMKNGEINHEFLRSKTLLDTEVIQYMI